MDNNQWIRTKDRLPTEDGRYLVVENHAYKWVGISQFRYGRFDMPTSHWMNLPELPPENDTINNQ